MKKRVSEREKEREKDRKKEIFYEKERNYYFHYELFSGDFTF